MSRLDLLTNLAQFLDEIKDVHRPAWWSAYHDELRYEITGALHSMGPPRPTSPPDHTPIA